jgi:uncharacterized membrane protein YfcA
VPELIAALCGIGIGVIGTLIGAGGGFFMVPAILLLKPEWSTETVTAFSIAVVTANASMGAFSYARAKRIDLRSFAIFSLAALPGAALGAVAGSFIPRAVFDPVFGVVLVGIGIWLFVRPKHHAFAAHPAGAAHRLLTDRYGVRYEWWFDMRVGIASAAIVGFLSNVLGIGGGIVHVPVLVTLLGFPEHIATATSHAVLAVTSLAGLVIHAARGDFRSDDSLVIAASAGAIIGAPIGARLSRQVPGAVILRILAVALASVGVRLLFAH